MNGKGYQQKPNTQTKRLSTEKQKSPNWTETQNQENLKTSHLNTTQQTQEEKIIVELIKKIMTEKKDYITISRKPKLVEIEKINKSLTNTLTDNITQLNENFGTCNRSAWNDPQKLGKTTGGVRNLKTSWNHPDSSIIEVGKNTEKSPGDLRRLL